MRLPITSGAAFACGMWALAPAAAAETSANISLTSDYVFRGISLSDNGPAIQGGFDWSSDTFYAGVWASSLSVGVELDAYVGFTPTTGPISWDIGAIGYFYPGADDDAAEFDYAEVLVAGEYSWSESLTIGAAAYYAPENYGDTGEAVYIEINGALALSDTFAISAAYGNQTIADPDGPFGAAAEDDYNSWNIGGTLAVHGFELDLRYHATDIEAGSDIESYTFGAESYDDRFVLTISRAL